MLVPCTKAPESLIEGTGEAAPVEKGDDAEDGPIGEGGKAGSPGATPGGIIVGMELVDGLGVSAGGDDVGVAMTIGVVLGGDAVGCDSSLVEGGRPMGACAAVKESRVVDR